MIKYLIQDSFVLGIVPANRFDMRAYEVFLPLTVAPHRTASLLSRPRPLLERGIARGLSTDVGKGAVETVGAAEYAEDVEAAEGGGGV